MANYFSFAFSKYYSWSKTAFCGISDLPSSVRSWFDSSPVNYSDSAGVLSCIISLIFLSSRLIVLETYAQHFQEIYLLECAHCLCNSFDIIEAMNWVWNMK